MRCSWAVQQLRSEKPPAACTRARSCHTMPERDARHSARAARLPLQSVSLCASGLMRDLSALLKWSSVLTKIPTQQPGFAHETEPRWLVMLCMHRQSDVVPFAYSSQPFCRAVVSGACCRRRGRHGSEPISEESRCVLHHIGSG